MAYDEKLAERVRRLLAAEKAVAEIRMFGGLCFTLRGHMCCGLLGERLIVRIDPADAPALLKDPRVRPFDFTGRPMKNILTVSAQAVATPAALKSWLTRGVSFASSLPPKV